MNLIELRTLGPTELNKKVGTPYGHMLTAEAVSTLISEGVC
ncbi:hypothetical protein ACIQVK_18815 [Streptomyces sp. NPDC090493]